MRIAFVTTAPWEPMERKRIRAAAVAAASAAVATGCQAVVLLLLDAGLCGHGVDVVWEIRDATHLLEQPLAEL